MLNSEILILIFIKNIIHYCKNENIRYYLWLFCKINSAFTDTFGWNNYISKFHFLQYQVLFYYIRELWGVTSRGANSARVIRQGQSELRVAALAGACLPKSNLATRPFHYQRLLQDGQLQNNAKTRTEYKTSAF